MLYVNVLLGQLSVLVLAVLLEFLLYMYVYVLLYMYVFTRLFNSKQMID